MDFFETVNERKSIRAFQEKKVDPKLLLKLLEAVNRAPSAGNVQAYHICVVRDRKSKEGLMIGCFEQESVALAPIVLVFCASKMQSEAKYAERGYDMYAMQDATIAAAYCQLAATALGLGSVWVGGFDPLEVSRILKLDEHEVPVAIIPIGHPAGTPERTPRKNLKELVREI
jgi:nitroreductase